MKSREVFEDCKVARDCFIQAVERGDYQQAKIMWFSCITLLRAIGHVLHKVDAKFFNSELKIELDRHFQCWKSSDPIFKDFIEKERNLILKEYDATVEIKECEEVVDLISSDGFRLFSSDGFQLKARTTLKSLVKAKGYCEGESPISILNEAIEWWDENLVLFESKIN
jgi:hypothetical protein